MIWILITIASVALGILLTELGIHLAASVAATVLIFSLLTFQFSLILVLKNYKEEDEEEGNLIE